MSFDQDSENRFYTWVWVIAAIIIINIAWAIAWGATVTDRTAIEAGYVQKVEPAAYKLVWVKP